MSIKILFSLLILTLILSLVSSNSTPRPLILEFPSYIHASTIEEEEEEVELRCGSWRFLAEANNLAPWKTIPAECEEHVRDYMVGKRYRSDLDMVAGAAVSFARSVELAGDGMDSWVFDIDETLLSNLPYYSAHLFGLERFNAQEFDKWVEKGMAPAIVSSLKLYEEVLGLGFKIFLLTGRAEAQRTVTADNLNRVGIREWQKLILRSLDDHEKTATAYKSEKRAEIIADGYRILGNAGDQWSDLQGSATSNRSFKLPNPMYFIP